MLQPPTVTEAQPGTQALRIQRLLRAKDSDDDLRQRLRELLELGFSEAALREGIRQEGGGPCKTTGAMREAVSVLKAMVAMHGRLRRRQQQQQQQQQGREQGQGQACKWQPMSNWNSSVVFAQPPTNIANSVRWLRKQFGLSTRQLTQVCARSPALLERKLQDLQHNWAAVERTFAPPLEATDALRFVLRRGLADVILLHPEAVRWPACLPTSQPASPPTRPPACLPARQPASQPACLRAGVDVSVLSGSKHPIPLVHVPAATVHGMQAEDVGAAASFPAQRCSRV